MSACYLGGARNQFGLRQAGPWDSQVGEVARRQELNRAEQPAIHMDQVDRLSINGLPLESKTPAQAREELLREIRIAAAIRVSLYVSRCLLQLHFPSPAPPTPFLLATSLPSAGSQRNRRPSPRWFIHSYYVLSGEDCWPLSGIQSGFCRRGCVQGGNMVWARGLIRSKDKMLLRVGLHTDEQPEEYRGRRNGARRDFKPFLLSTNGSEYQIDFRTSTFRRRSQSWGENIVVYLKTRTCIGSSVGHLCGVV